MHWLFLLILTKSASALYCLEGTNCEPNNQCDRCEGAACVRVARPSRKLIYISDATRTSKQTKTFFGDLLQNDNIDFHGPNVQVALTCLPESADIYEMDSEGCRTDSINMLRTCICHGYDYCNFDSRSGTAYFTISLSFVILMFFPFV